MPLTSSAGEIQSWLALTLTPGLSSANIRALLQRFGSPEEVLRQSLTTLSGSLDRGLAQHLLDAQKSERVEAALRWLEQDGNHLIALGEPEYPPLLLECGDPPTVLYVKGRRELLRSRALAVVGSRNPTPQGLQNAERFSQSLSDAGLTIVSGLALGIDAAAHKGALSGRSSSIAVVGTGLDIVYPARNRDLAHRLAEEGALVSEFPLGTPGLAGNFPRRNRIISGLSLGCLVVEAAIASGSLITARLAGEQGRDIFAIPGSIHSPLSKGCHQLIKQGAKLVESAEDVLAELGMGAGAPRSAQSAPPAVGEKDELLRAMGHDPVSVDELSVRCNLPAEEIQSRLLQLELSGLIAVMAGGKVQRLA
jgi:DNA processing protein